MHYFLILKTPYANGITTIYNFSPRIISRRDQNHVIDHLLWPNGIEWCFKPLDSIRYGAHFTFDHQTAI